MEGKIKTLNIMLIIFIALGALITGYTTLFLSIIATDSGGGSSAALTGGLFGFAFTFSLFVFLPYWARKSLKEGKAVPCIIHAVITIAMMPLLLPISIWEIVLAVKIKEHFDTSTA